MCDTFTIRVRDLVMVRMKTVGSVNVHGRFGQGGRKLSKSRWASLNIETRETRETAVDAYYQYLSCPIESSNIVYHSTPSVYR